MDKLNIQVMSVTTYNFYKIVFLLGIMSLVTGAVKVVEHLDYGVHFFILGILMYLLTKEVVYGIKIHVK